MTGYEKDIPTIQEKEEQEARLFKAYADEVREKDNQE